MGLAVSIVPPGGLVIEIDNLSVSRGGVTVVEDIDLRIKHGEFVGIVGPNGSGKTSMILAILGLIKSQNGSVKIYGEPNVAKYFTGKVSWVSQSAANLPKSTKVTVRELVSLGTVTKRDFFFPLNSEKKRKVEEMVEIVGLSEFIDKDFSILSGGQRQRAVIAKALASNADLILLDEPLVGVDRSSRNSLLKLLDNLCHDKNKTIVMISHDLAAIKQTTHRIVYLDGNIRFDGKPEDLPDIEQLANLRGINAVHDDSEIDTFGQCCDKEDE